jgi:HAD superfamily hydrolase (TIGR01509 family)
MLMGGVTAWLGGELINRHGVGVSDSSGLRPRGTAPALRAVLLDIDGTLVDSNDAHARSWKTALAQHGHVVPFDQIRSLIGKGGDKLLAEVASIDKESAQGKAIDELRGQLFRRDELPGLKPFPKARELLQRLRDSGLDLVVATSAKEAEMDALLEVCGARELVHARSSSDEAKRSKPDPDIIEVALRKAGVAAEAALMLGDTPYDIIAAARSDVRTVALRCGGWKDTDLDAAAAIYQDAADVLAHYDESPFARGR